jgi:uncharacterized protein YjbJ (UPF0337 family)
MATTKKRPDDTFGEEASAFGERAKGAVKDAFGAVTGNERLEREGERENAEGRARQANNNVFDETDGVRGATTGTGRSWVTGTFSDRDSAERAYNSMMDRGYTRDDVNLMMSDDTRKRYFADAADTELGSKAMEGAGVGGAIGSVTGGILAALTAIGTSIALPGIGLIVAGPIVAGLAGAGAGGLTGGIIGALIGSGIPEDRAKLYESDIRNGGIVMGVNPRSPEDAEYFEREWKGYQGRNVYR